VNYENIEDWLADLRPNWQMVRHIRGMTRDRKGKLYWLYIWEYRPGHFRLCLYVWPSLSFSDWLLAGWLATGVTQSPTSWTIDDVRVRHKQRGVGTALVKAAIALARRRGAQELSGTVISGDVRDSPFLPEWYARLGFTVQFGGEADTDPWGLSTHATFRMDLSPATSSSGMNRM